jgi:exopolyphosphatase/pppGpp-phosphohydrolase
MKSKRLAAIDIGTNSIRSIVVEADASGSFRILDDEKVMVRLGEGLHETGRISADAAHQGCLSLVAAAGVHARDVDCHYSSGTGLGKIACRVSGDCR